MTDRQASPANANQPSLTADTASATTQAGTSRTQAQTRDRVPRTRAGATWIGACVAVVVLVALIIFVAQNMLSVSIFFLGMHGQFPLAITLVAAAVGGALITLILGSTRILQLRRSAHRAQRARRVR